MENETDKSGRLKNKNKKPASKPKTRRKSDGPTCSMFLSELTRKLSHKKKQPVEETDDRNSIVHTIIDSITNALPVTVSKKTPERKDSPMKIETLQTFAPELLPNDTIEVPQAVTAPVNPPEDISYIEEEIPVNKKKYKIPKMPLVNSDVLKAPVQRRRQVVETEDAAVNTGTDHDVAAELAKHVATLKKISLIAEEFNQKTAKNLKEIVDSVQEDLLNKLEEVRAEQRAAKAAAEKPLTVGEPESMET